jgi:ParB family chromosome partitioning protein
MNIIDLHPDVIDPPTVPHRLSIDRAALDELAADIRANGLRQPIEVRAAGERYEIIAGHRRYLACRSIAMRAIPCIIKDTADDAHTETLRAGENLHREQLTPMEEALALERVQSQTHATPAELAKRWHRTPHWIKTRLALLELPDELKGAIHRRELSVGAALALLDVDDAAHRANLAGYAIASGASIAVIEEWVRQYIASKALNPTAAAPLPTPPEPGQAVIIKMPCFLCGAEHDYTNLLIRRACPPCVRAVEAAARTPAP